jgi:hypothetical protein
VGKINSAMETINVFEWFLEKNADNKLVAPALETKLSVTQIFIFDDFKELVLSDSKIINGVEVRFEALNLRKLQDKYTVQIVVYLDNYLVYNNQKYQFEFV